MTDFAGIIRALARAEVKFLDTLIRVKRAAGRPKDLEAIAELEGLREEQRGD
jgi:hypothetical protein